ncbi:MAG: sulfite exporter TauE/SafE family protein [Acetobacteraceae bacterium]|nr:sulfite exporter TauE/SafE family protein [Acetobacteraceae bacterium]
MTAAQDILALLSGGVVGFTLGLIGGGGSILAVPLLLYVVGMDDPHRAIGTTAVAVAFNAATGAVSHARRGNVRWPTAAVFSAAGILGAAIGSTLGKQFDGQRLLTLFALLMIVIAALMLRRRGGEDAADAKLTWRRTGKLAAVGLGVGMLAGFFGIGGGFLIVPGLVLATGMPMIAAVGTSLISVFSFGLTTAANYALSGLVVWPVAGLFILGGLGGGVAGSRLAHHLSSRRNALNRVFAAVIVVVALYMLSHSLGMIGR